MNWISVVILLAIGAGFSAAVRYMHKHGGACGHDCGKCQCRCREKK